MRILSCWELGSGFGHIDRMLVCARALRARGHEVLFALRDLSRAHARIAAEGFAICQAPVWLPRMVNPPPLPNYTSVLAAAGWLDPRGLAGLLDGWQWLMRSSGAELVLADHAPTALLAARGLGLPTWAIGNSFEVPPTGAHFPPMQHWNPVAAKACAAADALLLKTANEALSLRRDKPLPQLTALMDEPGKALLQLPGLTHYPDHAQQTHCVGPVFVDNAGDMKPWPAGDGPKVFAYVAPEHKEFEALMQLLRSRGCRGLVFAKGIAPAAAERLGGKQLHIVSQPLRMDALLAEADLVVSHASLGTLAAAALAGKPQLCLPNHTEQDMMAWQVETHGLGLALRPQPRRLDTALDSLLSDAGFAQRAQAFASLHAGASPARTGESVANLIEASLH